MNYLMANLSVVIALLHTQWIVRVCFKVASSAVVCHKGFIAGVV